MAVQNKHLWELVKETEERMTNFDRDTVVGAVLSVIARRENHALGIWRQRDIANRIMNELGWSEDRWNEALELAEPIWADIQEQLEEFMNDFDILDNVNIASRIQDAVLEKHGE